MTVKKGGIGRRPGKKGNCKQKVVTKSSMTQSKMTAVRIQKELDMTLDHRRQRRIIAPEKVNITIKAVNEKSMTKQLLKKRIRSLTRTNSKYKIQSDVASSMLDVACDQVEETEAREVATTLEAYNKNSKKRGDNQNEK